MHTLIILSTLLSPGHLLGEGGMIGPASPTRVVQKGNSKVVAPLHGQALWEYGQGLEPLLDDKGAQKLRELREKKIMLESIAVACGVVGSAVATLGLYLSPNFVNVSHPDPAGLTVPILIASGGAALGLVSVPLLVLSPGDVEIKNLILAHNNENSEDQQIRVMERLLESELGSATDSL